MAPADFHTLLRARPFVPFRVVTTDGTTYEVRHPEMVLVAHASAVIGYPDPRDPGTAQRYDIVSMRHIVRLEPGVQPAEQT
ncbi:MAG: hypothetical protein U0736_02910 [Gemmataceae bacterium]